VWTSELVALEHEFCSELSPRELGYLTTAASYLDMPPLLSTLSYYRVSPETFGAQQEEDDPL
jgi:hypothetical protein